LGIRIDIIGGVFSGIIATWLVYGSGSAAATIGFTLTLITNFNTILLMWVRTFNGLEVQGNRYIFLITLQLSLRLA
jgi:hypothetical protein